MKATIPRFNRWSVATLRSKRHDREIPTTFIAAAFHCEVHAAAAQIQIANTAVPSHDCPSRPWYGYECLPRRRRIVSTSSP
jgi:hypothetical protein